LWVVCQTTRC